MRQAEVACLDAYPPPRTHDRIPWWELIQGRLQHLALLIPLFGRTMGNNGGYIHSRQSTFCTFLENRILSPVYISVLLDRVYSSSDEQLENNVNFGLPRRAEDWIWFDHVSSLVAMLQGEVSTELAAERMQQERAMMFSDTPRQSTPGSPPRGSSPKHSSLSAPQDSNNYGEPDNAFHGLRDAYGKSGSGEATSRMQDVIKKSESYQQRYQQRAGQSVRFDQKKTSEGATSSDKDQICFAYAVDPSSCAYGSTCKYRHLDDEKDAKQLLEHLRSQAREKRTARHHSIDSTDEFDDQQVVIGSSKLSAVHDPDKED